MVFVTCGLRFLGRPRSKNEPVRRFVRPGFIPDEGRSSYNPDMPEILPLQPALRFQGRAFAFYQQLGFYEIPRYGNDPEDVGMELVL